MQPSLCAALTEFPRCSAASFLSETTFVEEDSAAFFARPITANDLNHHLSFSFLSLARFFGGRNFRTTFDIDTFFFCSLCPSKKKKKQKQKQRKEKKRTKFIRSSKK
jgi:hypothetical protein